MSVDMQGLLNLLAGTTQLDGQGAAQALYDSLGGQSLADALLSPTTKVTRAALQSITSSSNTKVQFDTEVWDSDGFYSAAAASRITIPADFDGIYEILGWAKFAANATGVRSASIYKNNAEIDGGAKLAAAASGVTFVSCRAIESLVAGDYIELNVFHDRGSALDISGAFLSLVKVA